MTKRTIIVMAEDDEDDRLLAKAAFEEGDLNYDLRFVEDGAALIDFLKRRGAYASIDEPLPGLVLLDLNMPRMDGREALRKIREDAALRRLPVVVLTTSSEDEDITSSYDLGANSYITKPVTFEALVETVTMLEKYWFHTVQLPPRSQDG